MPAPSALRSAHSLEDHGSPAVPADHGSRVVENLTQSPEHLRSHPANEHSGPHECDHRANGPASPGTLTRVGARPHIPVSAVPRMLEEPTDTTASPMRKGARVR